MCRFMYVLAAGAAVMGLVTGCGNSDGETEADRIGVGAECTVDPDPDADPPSTCPVVEMDTQLQCLTQFTGGYCGLENCGGDVHCPAGSACVTNDDTMNYCYRLCEDREDCNLNRPQNPANCVGSGTINFVEGGTERKACEPPSSGS